MAGHYNLRSNDDDGSSYAALPGTQTGISVRRNITPMKSNLAPGREMAGCHPSRWIYELINNKFTTCDLFQRARLADLGADYKWDHPHTLVINGNQSYNTPNGRVLSTICLECHFHFVFRMAWDEKHAGDQCEPLHVSWPIRDDMFPWHHLVWAGSDADHSITADQSKYYPLLARENFFCSAAPCTFQLTLEVSKPRMGPEMAALLLDSKAIAKELAIAREQDPSRYENATDDWPNQAPANLNTYLKNILESESKTIQKRNKRFAVLFGPRCFSIFRYLEFAEEVLVVDDVDEGSFKPTVPDPADGPSGSTRTGTFRGFLEDVRSEVQCLIHKAGRRADESPTYCVSILHADLRCQEPAGANRSPLADEERCQVLGVLPGQGREIIGNAYKRQWELIPSQRRRLVDSLMGVANDVNDDLLSNYAMTQSSVFDSQAQPQDSSNDDGLVIQALSFLGLNPPNNYTAEALIQAFRKKLASDPASAHSARSMLLVIAKASTDDTLQAMLIMESDRQMSLETAKAVLGLGSSLGRYDETVRIAKTKLTASKGKEEAEAYLDALDAIAEHTDSGPMQQACAELRQLNGVSGPGPGSAIDNTSVDFGLPVGLDNIGNTCYLNSLLQYLFTVKPIRDIVLNYDDVKLDLDDESIQARRLGGARLTLERGEAVVAQAFARELAILFRNLETSDRSATRPSQRLANAVLLLTSTLLAAPGQQQQQKPTAPEAPPLPARPSPAPPKKPTQDVDMADASEASRNNPVETGSEASDQTLVDREEAPPPYSTDKVEVIPIEDSGEPGVSVAEIKVDDDMEMGEIPQTEDPKDQASKAEAPAVTDVGAEKKSDITMSNTEEPETIDQKVLSALEHQKRASGTDQEDVEEVMGSIINRLQAAIRPSSVDKTTGIQVEKIMETFFVTTVNYTKKFEAREYQHEISFDRSITAFPAPEGTCSLYEALGRNFDQQILEDSGQSRYTAIRTLPPILHVLIQRSQSTRQKNGNAVTIPETLYLDRFMDAPHDSATFTQRKEEWAASSRIADLKSQLAKIGTWNVTLPQCAGGEGEASTSASRPATPETWDFDGPVEDDFVMVNSAQQGIISELPSPPEGMDLHGVEIQRMMEAELAERQGTLDAHMDSLKEIPYRLHAVICHRGHLMSGHYWVWIHDFEDNVWRSYNDAQVQDNRNTAEVLEKLSTSGEPYFLCYVRDGDQDNYVNVPKRRRPGSDEDEPTKPAGDADVDVDGAPAMPPAKDDKGAPADEEVLMDA